MNMHSTQQYIDWLATFGRSNIRTSPYVLLQRHGLKFCDPWEHGYARGPMGMCFRNSLTLAIDSCGELTYCEGYAIGHLIPVHHAWCVDREGRTIETTWPDMGSDYFGIPFQTPYATRAALDSGYYSILFNMNFERVMTDDPATFVKELR